MLLRVCDALLVAGCVGYMAAAVVESFDAAMTYLRCAMPTGWTLRLGAAAARRRPSWNIR